MALLAHFTDTHLTPPGVLCEGAVDTAACLTAAVDTLLRLPQRPTALMITGDLADGGDLEAYRLAARLLGRLPMPWYVIPGNHDARDAMREILPAHMGESSGPFIQYRVQVDGLTVLALDTLVPGVSHGALCNARLAWLADALADTGDSPVLIAMHHPPVDTGIAGMDAIGLREGAAAFAIIVARHANVQAILCGHQHRAITLRHAGTLVCVGPSTAHQVALDFSPTPLRWNREPPGFMLHRLTPQTGLVSHVVPCGSYPAQPFG